MDTNNVFFKSSGLLMDGGSGDFTEDPWFSSASNPGFLMEAEQSMGNVLAVPPGLLAWETMLNSCEEERPTDVPRRNSAVKTA